MGLYQWHLILTLLVFFLTTGCHVVNTQQENVVSSSLFYQQSTYPRNCKEIQAQCSPYNSTGVFLIKPDGCLDPFEVYCDSTDYSGGWIVIQRRSDGAINFNRSWESYESGFGFLSQEFWIGNKKLAFLTNQEQYQLVIEMTTFNNSLIWLTYDNFRISDSYNQYKVATLGQYGGSADAIVFCGTNMICGNCQNECQRTCEAPNDCQNIECIESASCVCPDGFFVKGSDCVAPDRCRCYDEVENTIIQEGSSYVNLECTRKGSCINQQIAWNEMYKCSPNAVCEVREDIRQCYCIDGYTGDGETCIRIDTEPTDCQEVYERVSVNNGVYGIKPINWTGSAFDVYCNMTNDGGWTVFQRRVDGSENFDVGWTNYKQGFGNIRDEFWLGNDKIYFLTNQKRYQLRIDIVNRGGDAYHADYDDFRINSESDNYRLSELGMYSGTAGDGCFLCFYNNQFTTNDRDNDIWKYGNCASNAYGGWWFSGCYCNGCFQWWLNGQYGSSFIWNGRHPNLLQYSQIMIRPL